MDGTSSSRTAGIAFFAALAASAVLPPPSSARASASYERRIDDAFAPRPSTDPRLGRIYLEKVGEAWVVFVERALSRLRLAYLDAPMTTASIPPPGAATAVEPAGRAARVAPVPSERPSVPSARSPVAVRDGREAPRRSKPKAAVAAATPRRPPVERRRDERPATANGGIRLPSELLPTRPPV